MTGNIIDRDRILLAADGSVLDSVADVAEVLMGEFGHRISLAKVSDIVLTAHRDLVGQVPSQAYPELLYRLARERLGS